MGKRGRASIPALILALAACPSPARLDAPGSLEVHYELDLPSARPREGDLVSADLRLRNGTDRPAVLRNLIPERSAGAVLTWQFSQPPTASIEYVQERDEWVYDRRRPGKPRPVLNSGLVLPGEEVSVRLRLRLLHLPQEFRITYFSLSRPQVAERVYFESGRERESRYRLLAGDELDSRLRAESRRDATHHRVVVFPYGELSLPLQVTAFRIDSPLDPRPFTLQQAERKVGGRISPNYTYTTALDGWVVETPEGLRLVTPERVAPLPEIRNPERLFFYVDSVGVGKLELELDRESIRIAFKEKRYAVLPQSRDGRTRHASFLHALDLPRLFADVRELKLALDVRLTEDGGGRMIVTR